MFWDEDINAKNYFPKFEVVALRICKAKNKNKSEIWTTEKCARVIESMVIFH